MKKLAFALALILAPAIAAQEPGAAYKLDKVAIRLDGQAGGSASYSAMTAPTGCAATEIAYFTGTPPYMGCTDATFTLATKTLALPYGAVTTGNLTATGLATPAITSPLTVNGTPGATTYGYKVTALLADTTTTAASAEVTIATGNATLDGTNSITVAWPAVTGAASYKLYRTTGGAAPPKLIYAGALLTFTDIGAAGTSETPATVDGTGVVTADGLILGATGTARIYGAYTSPTQYAGMEMLAYSDALFGLRSVYTGGGMSAGTLLLAGWSNVQIGAGPVFFGADIYPPDGTTTLLGNAAKQWDASLSKARVYNSIQGSQSKALTDNVATQFASISIPQTAGANYAGATVEFTIFASDGTNMAVQHGSVKITALNIAGTESVTVGTPDFVTLGDGTASLDTPAFTATGGADLIDLKVQSNATGITPTIHTIEYRPDMPHQNVFAGGT